MEIIMQATAVFDTSMSKALKNGKIDEEEFNMLQTLNLKVLNGLANVDHKMEAENRNQFEKVFWKRNKIKKNLRTKI